MIESIMISNGIISEQSLLTPADAFTDFQIHVQLIKGIFRRNNFSRQFRIPTCLTS